MRKLRSGASGEQTAMKASEPDSFVAAAQYLRKSTVEHQRYSIDNQITAIQEYAAAKRYEIVQSYVDAGRSGLLPGWQAS
jgi:Resolvase, N terminal domain